MHTLFGLLETAEPFLVIEKIFLWQDIGARSQCRSKGKVERMKKRADIFLCGIIVKDREYSGGLKVFAKLLQDKRNIFRCGLGFLKISEGNKCPEDTRTLIETGPDRGASPKL